MEFTDRNTRPDALEQLLKEFMLERDPQGPGGESLMEVALGSVVSNSPVVSPSPEKEAAMLARLKENFPAAPAPPMPGPIGGSGGSFWTPGLKFAALGVTTLAIGLTAIIILTQPFSGNQGKNLDPVSGNGPKDLISFGEGDNATSANHSHNIEIPAMNSPEGDRDANEVATGNPKRIKGGNRPLIRNFDPQRTPELAVNPLSPENNPNPALMSEKEAIKDAKVDLFPLRDLFARSVVASEFDQFSGQKDKLVLAKNGTLLHIPQDAFTDQRGLPYKGEVKLEIKEIYNPSDYLRSNLPTLTRELQLISGGILYVEATGSQGLLKLAPGKDIYVEFDPKNEVNTREMLVSGGTFDKSGHIDWRVLREKPTKMIPLPAEKLFSRSYFWCNSNDVWTKTFEKLFLAEYENTWVTTREFRQRLEVAWKFDHMSKVLDMYLSNVDKELWQVDLMVLGMLLSEFSTFQGQHVAQYKVEFFQHFAGERLTYAEKYNSHGVNLDAADATDQLRKKVGEGEADRIMRVHKLRRKYIADMDIAAKTAIQNNKEVRESDPHPTAQNAFTPKQGFLLETIGWVHLNKFMNPQKIERKAVSLEVELTGNLPSTQSRAFLVYQDERSIVRSEEIGPDKAEFSRVPSAKEVWIVAIGYEGETPYLGMKKIKLFESGVEKVKMKKTTVEEFVSDLKNLD